MYRLAFLLFSLSCSVIINLSAQPEAWYIERIALALGGEAEVTVANGRVDVVTDSHAIEVERASNWKHAIGQSLWYGLQTNKQPGIILLMESPEDRVNGIRLQSALDFAGIGDKITVWFYPEDFNESFESVQQSFNKPASPDPHATGYWLSSNSSVRHNKNCQWYTRSKGRYCKADEGKPCGNCRG
ncbi:MAG: hypothetical protein M3R25_11950 [Bacteroidota bacterium]|nr:hypothetical protein [Bacteroidota bacterium]